MRRAGLPILIFPIVRYEENLETLEDEYQPTGDRVESSAFCQSAETISIESACWVCLSDLDLDAEDPGKKPVVTGCNHHFHEGCLNN
jgi:hypothetical protein